MSKTILLLCLVAFAVTLRVDEHEADYLDAGKYTLQDASGKYLVDACFTCTDKEQEHAVLLQDIPHFKAHKNLQAVWIATKWNGRVWFTNKNGIKLFSNKKHPENVFVYSTFSDDYN